MRNETLWGSLLDVALFSSTLPLYQKYSFPLRQPLNGSKIIFATRSITQALFGTLDGWAKQASGSWAQAICAAVLLSGLNWKYYKYCTPTKRPLAIVWLNDKVDRGWILNQMNVPSGEHPIYCSYSRTCTLCQVNVVPSPSGHPTGGFTIKRISTSGVGILQGRGECWWKLWFNMMRHICSQKPKPFHFRPKLFRY